LSAIIDYKGIIDDFAGGSYRNLLSGIDKFKMAKTYVQKFKSYVQDIKLPDDDKEVLRFLIDAFHDKFKIFVKKVTDAAEEFSRKTNANIAAVPGKPHKLWPGLDPTPKAKATAAELLLKATPLIDKISSIVKEDPNWDLVRTAFGSLIQKVKTNDDLISCRDELKTIFKTVMDMKLDMKYDTNRPAHTAFDNVLTALTPVVKMYKDLVSKQASKVAQYAPPIEFEDYRQSVFKILNTVEKNIHKVYADIFNKAQKTEGKTETYPAMKKALVNLSKVNQKFVFMIGELNRLRMFDPEAIPAYIQKTNIGPLLNETEDELEGVRVYYHDQFDSMYESLHDLVTLSQKYAQEIQGHRHLVKTLYAPYERAMQYMVAYINSLLDAKVQVSNAGDKKTYKKLDAVRENAKNPFRSLEVFWKKYKAFPLEKLPEKSQFLVDVIKSLSRDVKSLQNIDLDEAGKKDLTSLLEETINQLKTYLNGLNQLDKD
jgi:hypothetical protein